MGHIYNKTWSGGAKPLTAVRPMLWYQHLCRSQQRGAVSPPPGSSTPGRHWEEAQPAALRTTGRIGKILHILVMGWVQGIFSSIWRGWSNLCLISSQNEPSRSLCRRKLHNEKKLLGIDFKLIKIRAIETKKKSPVNREGNKIRRSQQVSCCIFDTTLQQKNKLESWEIRKTVLNQAFPIRNQEKVI